jgi:hypothetical protein
VEHVAGEAAVGREAEPGEPLGDVGLVVRDVGEVQFVRGGVEEEERGPLGVQHLSTLGHDDLDQVVQLDPRRKRGSEVVQQPEPTDLVGCRVSHGGCVAGRPKTSQRGAVSG